MKTPYFLYLEYFATGEGASYSFGVFLAEDKEAAIEDFLRKTKVGELGENTTSYDNAVKYFGPAVKVMDLSTSEGMESMLTYLKIYLTKPTIECITAAENGQALMEFHFHLYYNYS